MDHWIVAAVVASGLALWLAMLTYAVTTLTGGIEEMEKTKASKGMLTNLESQVKALAKQLTSLNQRVASREPDFKAIFGKLARRYSAIWGLYNHLGLTYHRVNDDMVTVTKVPRSSSRNPRVGRSSRQRASKSRQRRTR